MQGDHFVGNSDSTPVIVDYSTYAHSARQNSAALHNEPSYEEIFNGLRARWWIVLAASAVMGALSWIYCSMQDPLYNSRSLIEIRGYAPLLSAATVENMYGADTRKLEYQKTTIAKLKQPGVAELVLTDAALQKDLIKYFGIVNKAGDNADASAPSRKLINSYLGTIDINPVSETSLVEIEATTREPELSARIANAHASGFIAALRAERRESMRTNIAALELQEAELRSKLQSAERAMADYSEESHLVVGSSGDSKDVGLQKLMGLNQLLSQATEKRLRTEGLYVKLEAVDINKSSTLDTEPIRETLSQIESMEIQAAALGQKVTGEYPEMKELKAKIEVLRNSVVRQRQQLFTDLKLKLESEISAENRLRDEIAREENELNVNSKKMGQLLVLRKESDSLRQLYENVLKQLQETKISATSGVSNIFLSDVARPSSDPAFPKTKFFVELASVIGAGLGFLFIIISELVDARIKTTDEAARVLGVPVLGAIPRFVENGNGDSNRVLSRAKKLLPWRVEPANSDVPENSASVPAKIEKAAGNVAAFPNKIDSAALEALKTIRAGILLSSVDTEVRVIAVTSANKGEGKSTLAINLAACLAQAERRTLLLDADLRESCLAGNFSALFNKPGLSELLAGNPGNETLQPIQLAHNLFVLPAGVRPPNPAEMLGSKKMSAALAEFKASFDFVVIDCPPVLPVADSLVVAHEADGVIMVARSEKTHRKHAREALSRLRRVRANILGVVVNDTNLQREHTYGAAQNLKYFTVDRPLKKTA